MSQRIRRPKGESDIARFLIDQIIDKTGASPVFIGGFFKYSCETGVWEPWPEIAVKASIQDLHTKHLSRVNRYQMNAAIEVMQVLCTTSAWFESARRGVSCSNGFVSVSTDGAKLVPHSPNHRSRFGYSYAYDARLRPDRFLKFLREVWAPDPDREDKILALAEFIGACITGCACQFEQAMMLHGRQGQNGKSVLIAVIEKLFAEHTRASIPPQNWGDEYYVAELLNARINLVGELPRTEIVDGAYLKAIVSGEAITGRPIRQSPVRFKPVAGHLFACNNLPAVSDVGHAFWRRWLMMKFNRQFEGTRLKDELIAELSEDVSGLLSWAIAGAVRLLRQGKYTLPVSSAKAKEEWAERTDQVKAFMVECTDAKGKCTLAKLYEDYRHWALLNGHSRLSRPTFKDRLIGLGHEPKRGDTATVYNFGLKDRDEWGGSGLLSVVS